MKIKDGWTDQAVTEHHTRDKHSQRAIDCSLILQFEVQEAIKHHSEDNNKKNNEKQSQENLEWETGRRNRQLHDRY